MSRLLKFSEVISAFEPVGNYATTELRQFMRGNVESNNSKFYTPSKYEYDWHEGCKTSWSVGRKWSHYIAQLKSKRIDEIEYIKRLRNTDSRIAMRLEPTYFHTRNKIESGEWQGIPINDYLIQIEKNHGQEGQSLYADFFDKFCNYQSLHFLHESVNEPMLVAYYPSIEYMRKGREVRTKFGKYLTQFANEFGINSQLIKELTEIHSARILARKGWQVHFIEHDDEQGWIDVYGSGVGSCMQGKSYVKVYAHDKSVLRLAHIKTNEGMTLARCIVREDKKEWIRCYPDPNGYAEGRHLKQSLESLGYTFGNLDGVLLQAIPCRDYSGHYVMPYVDDYGGNGYQRGWVETIDSKDYIMVSDEGDLRLNNTNGSTYDADDDDDAFYCDDCGDHYHEHQGSYSDYHGVWICEGCQEDNYVWAINDVHGNTDLIHHDDCIYCESDSEYYLDNSNLLANHNIHYCEIESAYFTIDDMVQTPDGLVHESHATRIDYQYQDEFDYLMEEDVHELSNGKLCHVDDAEVLQAEIDFNDAQLNLDIQTESSEVVNHE